MVFPYLAKGFKLATFFTAFSFLLCIQPAFTQQRINELDGVKSERYFAGTGYGAARSTLATTPMTAPLYSIVRTPDGKFSIMEPQLQDRQDLYTEVVLALLAQSVDNGIPEGPLDSFMEMIGGEELEECRIGYIQKTGDDFYASFIRKEPREGEPAVLSLRFSAIPAGKTVKKGEGAVVELVDGARVLITIGGLRDASSEYTEPDREKVAIVQEVKELVLEGNIDAAILAFFTSSAFQDNREDVVADLCNRLIISADERYAEREDIKAFLQAVMSNAVELIDDTEFSYAVQLMAGQALTIISWIEGDRIIGAERVRLTDDVNKMALNDKHGRSFIDNSTLPEGVEEVRKEGAPGFFWRGTERITKLGPNVSEKLIYDKARFNGSKDKIVMYLMDHGFFTVDDVLMAATQDGTVSTMHETSFMHDFLPGSYQTTSTGAGHFQETKLDLKCVTAGRGIQFNVRYGADGSTQEVIAQELKPGDWTVALPGYVDYMVNLGGLRFNDMSVNLSEEDAGKFSPAFDFSPENLAKVKDAVSRSGKVAPYTGAVIEGKAYLLTNRDDAPAIVWSRGIPHLTENRLPIDFLYNTLSSDQMKSFVSGIYKSYEEGLSRGPADNVTILPFKDEVLDGAKGAPAGSLGKTETVNGYTDSDSRYFQNIAYDVKDKTLVRVSIEQIISDTSGNVKTLVSEMSKTPNICVELFAATPGATVDAAKYTEYDIEKKALPSGFVMSRENTVTLMPVLKSELVSTRGKADDSWGIGDIQPTDTIISPIGLVNDKAGLIRGILTGLKLNDIARQAARDGNVDEAFVEEVLGQYRAYCVSMGVKDFNVTGADIVNMATGNINKLVDALNRLIKSMPILPLNAEEIRIIYEHAREALIRA